MRLHALVGSTLALVAFCLAAPAFAQEPAADVAPFVPTAKPRPYFVGISAGVAYVTVRHPEILASSFAAATLGLHAGYSFNDKWSVGFELTTAEKFVTREGPYALFVPEGLSPQASCDSCPEPVPGGWLGQITALFGTVGPRVEFSPFGRDGLYLSGSAGLGFVYGVDNRLGAAGTARVGYRLRIADIIGISLEGGFQGQAYKDAYALLPYGVLMFRPYF
jgi:hypothetical protein